MKRMEFTKTAAVLAGTVLAALRLAAADVTSLADDAELVEARTSVPRLKAAAAYEPAEGVIRLDLSEYAGYAGILAANGGLEPNEDSIFFKKHKLKVRIAISEEDSWSPLNSGQMAASGTTADVLPLYGAQLQAVTPLLIAFSRGADGVVVRQEIKQVNDLKGKVLAVAQFNESDFLIRYLAQQAGLEVALLDGLGVKPAPDKINLVACADSFGAGEIFLRDVTAGRSRLHGCVTWDPKTTEVVEGAKGKARLLLTNRNLLIVADILLVNRGFADKHPDMVRGLVEGILEGNDLVRRSPDAYRAVLAKAFKWDEKDVPGELAKVHLANLPENQAFFNGTIDAAGSYGYIYESAVMAYGSSFIPRPIPAEKFLDLKPLQAIQAAGLFAAQKAEIKPLRSGSGGPVEDPLLMRDVRFLFKPNSSELDRKDAKNIADLTYLAKMLQVSPGSTLVLRGHVDNGLVKKFEKEGGPQLVQKMAIKAVQLSKERCESVGKALVDLNQVDGSRLEFIGCGWKEPLGTDGDQNRRVEVQWFTIE